MIKKFVQDLTLIFISMLVITFVISVFIYKNRDLIPFTERPEFIGKLEHLKKYSTKYDTVLWGSSKVFYQLSPEIIKQRTGLKAFNFGVRSSVPPYELVLLDRISDDILQAKIKYLVVELSPLDSFRHDFDHPHSYYNLPMKHTLEFFAFYSNGENLRLGVRILQSIFYKYTRAIKLLFTKRRRGEKYLENNCGFDALDKKFVLNPSNEALNRRQGAFIKDKRPVIYSVDESRRWTLCKGLLGDFIPKSVNYQLYVEKLLKKFSDAGITVVLLISPGINGDMVLCQHGFLLARNNYPLLSFNSTQEYPELYDPKLYFDRAHFAQKGAELYTNIFVGQLIKNSVLNNSIQ